MPDVGLPCGGRVQCATILFIPLASPPFICGFTVVEIGPQALRVQGKCSPPPRGPPSTNSCLSSSITNHEAPPQGSDDCAEHHMTKSSLGRKSGYFILQLRFIREGRAGTQGRDWNMGTKAEAMEEQAWWLGHHSFPRLPSHATGPTIQPGGAHLPP